MSLEYQIWEKLAAVGKYNYLNPVKDLSNDEISEAFSNEQGDDTLIKESKNSASASKAFLVLFKCGSKVFS